MPDKFKEQHKEQCGRRHGARRQMRVEIRQVSQFQQESGFYSARAKSLLEGENTFANHSPDKELTIRKYEEHL